MAALTCARQTSNRAPSMNVLPASAVAPPPPVLAAERPQDRVLAEGLIARAFGPGRFAKTAERLRETNAPDLAMSLIAWDGGAAVGCVRQWPVRVGGTPALLLGPFAVEASHRGRGLGARLIRSACGVALRAGHGLIVLVGDEPFFGPLGFSVALAAKVRLPGPVDPRRVMARALIPGAADGLAGLVTVAA